MPSFIIHSIVGRELCKKLKFSDEDSKKFFIANLLPDIKQNVYADNLSDQEIRKLIQKEKRVTHFRNNEQDILEYPDLDLFLKTYGKLIEDLTVFGYFFHLYTDFYYFSVFLPKIIIFLDKEYKETSKKENNCFIKIIKTNEIITVENFWSKKNPKGIYHDYSALNKYLIDKYSFYFNYQDILSFFNSSLFVNKIEEIDIKNFPLLLKDLKMFYEEAKDDNSSFNIFSTDEVDLLINNIIISFIENYSYLFSKFLK